MSQTTAVDLSRQAAWEVRSTERAVARYRAAAERMDPMSLPRGRRALVETVGPVSKTIEAARDALMQATSGKPPPYVAPILAFNSEVLAVTAVAHVIQGKIRENSRTGITLTGFARAVSRSLRDQADYDRFVAAQMQAQREATAPITAEIRQAEKAGDGAKVRALSKVLSEVREDELLRAFRRRNPQADRRAWSRFAARIEGARSKPWDEDTGLSVAGFLADAMTRGAPDWFEMGRLGDGPDHRNPTCVVLTPHAVEQLAEATTRAELARPMLLPMLIPPNDWRHVEKEAA